MDDCPQCGEPTETLHEGICEDCRKQNHAERMEHLERLTWWNGLTAEQREAHIRWASQHGA